MTRYFELSGVGVVDMLTDQEPTRAVDQFVWVRHETLGLIQVHRNRLIAVMPPEPEDGTTWLGGRGSIYARRDSWPDSAGDRHWYVLGMGGVWDWAWVVRQIGKEAAEPVRLVPDPVAILPAVADAELPEWERELLEGQR